MRFQIAALVVWLIYCIQIQQTLTHDNLGDPAQLTRLSELKTTNLQEIFHKARFPYPNERLLDDSSVPLAYTFNYTSDYSTFVITFSKEFNLTSVNESSFDVQIPPFINNQDYNFTAMELADNQSVEIDVTYLKTVTNQTISITFYHNNSFVDADPTDPLFTTIMVEIPIQLSQSASSVDIALRIGINISFGVSMAALVISFLTKERATLLWNTLDFMQMIYILFFAGTELPWNLRSIVIGFSVSVLNFLPNAFQSLSFPSYQSIAYIVDQSYISFIFCFWPWFILAVIIGSLHAVVYISFRATKTHPLSNAKIIPFKHLIHWSSLLRLFFLGFLPLTFVIMVQIVTVSSDTIAIAGVVLGCLVFLVMCVIILVLIKVMRVEKYKLRHDAEYRAQFIVLYEGLKLRKPITKYWNFIDLFRKFMLAIIVGILHVIPIMQGVLLILQNLVYLAMFGIFRPYLKTKYNILTLLKEVLTTLIYGIVLAFEIDDKNGFLTNDRVFTGWAAVLLITIIYCTHLITFVADVLLSIKKKPTPSIEEEVDDDPTPTLPTVKVQKPLDSSFVHNQSNDQLMINEGKSTKTLAQTFTGQSIIIPTELQVARENRNLNSNQNLGLNPKMNSFLEEEKNQNAINDKDQARFRSQTYDPKLQLKPNRPRAGLTLQRSKLTEETPQNNKKRMIAENLSGKNSSVGWRENNNIQPEHFTNSSTVSTQDATIGSQNLQIVRKKAKTLQKNGDFLTNQLRFRLEK